MAAFVASLARASRYFSYVPLLGLAAALSLVKLVVYARLMGVEPFGVLGKMLLVSSAFGIVGSLGMQSVASRDLPALYARGRDRRAIRLLVQTLGVTSLVAALGIVGTLAGLGLLGLTGTESAVALTHGWAQAVFLTVAFERRSRLQMTRYAVGMCVRSAAIVMAGAAAAAGIGHGRGVLGVEAAICASFALLELARTLQRAKLPWAAVNRFRRRLLERAPWGSSLVLLGGTAVYFVAANLDRWIGAQVLDDLPFGHYSFAWLILLAAQSFQGLLNAGVLPLLAGRRAMGHGRGAWRATLKLSATLGVGGALLAVPLAWLLERIVLQAMPAYGAAVPLILPMLLAAVLRVSDFWGSLAIVNGHEDRMLKGHTVVTGLLLAVYAVGLDGAALTPQGLAWFAVTAAAASYVADVVAAWRR